MVAPRRASSKDPRRSGFDPPPGIPDYVRIAPGRESRQWVGIAIMGAALLGTSGYFAGEAGLAARPHPLHWLAAVAGAVIGAVGGAIIGAVREHRRWRRPPAN